jgi:hypothetical protein
MKDPWRTPRGWLFLIAMFVTPFMLWRLWPGVLSPVLAETNHGVRGILEKHWPTGKSVSFLTATPGEMQQAFVFADVAFFPESDLIFARLTRSNTRTGELLTRSGRWLGDAEFSYPDFSGNPSKGLYPASNTTGKRGYIDKHGRWAITPQYDMASPFRDGAAIVRINKGFHVIDVHGKSLIPASFQRIHYATPGWVIADDRWYQTDATGNWVVTANPYREIQPFNEKYVIAQLNDYSVLVDRAGKSPVSEHFQYIGRLIKGRALARDGHNKWGILNDRGAWVLAPTFVSLGMGEDGQIITTMDGSTVFLDDNGKPLPAGPQAAGAASEGLTPSCEELLCGYVDSAGKWAIPPRFEVAQRFANGVAQVRQNGLIAYIDVRGNLLTPAPPANAAAPWLWRPGAMRDAYSNNGGTVFGYINRAGKMVIPAVFSLAGDFAEHLAPAQGIHGESGYINPEGNWSIPPVFREALPFSEGLAAVKIPRRFMNAAYIDPQGHIALKLPSEIELAENLKNGKARVRAWSGGDYFIDRQGKRVDATLATRTDTPALQRLSINGGKWGYADAQDHFIIAPRFDAVQAFSEDLAAVRVGTQWGYIDRAGKTVIQPAYDQVGRFNEGIARVQHGERWTYIDRQGRPITAEQFTAANDFHEGLARVGIGLSEAKQRVGLVTDSEKLPDFMPGQTPMLSGGGDMQLGVTWVKLIKGGYYDSERIALMNQKGELIIPIGLPAQGSQKLPGH